MATSMIEPHVFCGPEFVLEVPLSEVEHVLTRQTTPNEGANAQPTQPSSLSSSSADPVSNSPNPSLPVSADPAGLSEAGAADWQVLPDCLRCFQTELILLCSPLTRRRLHWSEAFPLGSSPQALVYPGDAYFHAVGRLPEPCARLKYLSARPFAALGAEEAAALAHSVQIARGGRPFAPASVYFLLTLADSRLAAEVYWICLRKGSLALSRGSRVLAYFRRTAARAGPVEAAAVLRKREALRGRWNLDEDLFDALRAGLRGDAEVATAQAGGGLPGLLAYCEARVGYAGVLDAAERASPFLCAFGLFFALGLGLDAVFTGLLRHPRRVVRALGLFVARFVLPPEEVAAFFAEAVADEVGIALEDGGEGAPCTLAALARRLLLDREVGEAWPPPYAPFWRATVVEPALRHLQHRAAAARAKDTPAGHREKEEKKEEKKEEAKKGGEKRQGGLRGSGRGVAALGFRSLAEIGRFARARRARTLVPARLATLVVRGQRRGPGDSLDANDDEDEDEDEDDLGLLVEVEGGGAVASLSPAPQAPIRARGGAAAGPHSTAPAARAGPAPDAVVNPHAMILKEGYSIVMSLLGRTRPFHADERYLEF